MVPERAYVSFTKREIGEDTDLDPTSLQAALITQTKTSRAPLGTWHRRLSYILTDAVKKLLKHDMVTGMEISPDNKTESTCIPCLEGKQTQNEIPRQSNVTHLRVLHCIYSDLCGPMQTCSRQGKFYFLTFIDRNAHHVKVKLLVTKSETCQTIIALIEQAEVETRECINFFHSDEKGAWE